MAFIDSLWKYLLISSPFLLLGLFFAGVIHNFLNVDTIKKMLGGKKISSVFKAAIVGVPMPLCSCAVIPAAVTLRKNGANNGATSSFLISTPESGADSIAMTYAMMDLPMTIIRPVAAFVTAFIAGIGQFIFNDFEYVEESSGGGCCKKGQMKAEATFKEKFVGTFKYSFSNLINDMALWLAAGILVGALIDWLVPADWFVMMNGFWGRMVILGIGIPMYICASATTPIAASLIVKGMSPGSALIILLAGPATNSSNLMVLQKYIGKKGVVINVIAIALVSLGLSYAVDFIYSHWALPLNFNITHHHHEEGAAWWSVASAIILSVLILKGIWFEEIKPRLPKKVEAKSGSCH